MPVRAWHALCVSLLRSTHIPLDPERLRCITVNDGDFMTDLKIQCSQRCTSWLPAAIAATCLALSMPSHATDLQSYGGQGGDTPYRLECPPQSLLTGFAGHTGAHVSNMSIECRQRDSGTGKLGDIVEPLASSSGIASAGRLPGGAFRRKSCGQQDVVYTVNFLFVRSGPVTLDWLRARCMDPTDSRRPATEFDFPGADVPQLGDSIQAFPDSGWQSCPQGELPVGIHGTSKSYVDSIGLICRAVVESPRDRERDSSDTLRSPFGPAS
jgi:hypothetical protein